MKLFKRGEVDLTLKALMELIFAIALVTIVFAAGCQMFEKDLDKKEYRSFLNISSTIYDVYEQQGSAEVTVELMSKSSLMVFGEGISEIVIQNQRGDYTSTIERPDACGPNSESCLCLCRKIDEIEADRSGSGNFEHRKEKCALDNAVCIKPTFPFTIGGVCHLTEDQVNTEFSEGETGYYCDQGAIFVRDHMLWSYDRYQDIQVRYGDVGEEKGVVLCPRSQEKCVAAAPVATRPQGQSTTKEVEWESLAILGGRLADHRNFLSDFTDRCEYVSDAGAHTNQDALLYFELKEVADYTDEELDAMSQEEYEELISDDPYIPPLLSALRSDVTKPSIIVLSIGINDVLTSDADNEVLLSVMKSELAKVMSTFTDELVVVLELPPISGYAGRDHTSKISLVDRVEVIDGFNAYLRELEGTNVLIVPLYSLLEDIVVQDTLSSEFSNSGVDLNKIGYDVVNTLVYETLNDNGVGCS